MPHPDDPAPGLVLILAAAVGAPADAGARVFLAVLAGGAGHLLLRWRAHRDLRTPQIVTGHFVPAGVLTLVASVGALMAALLAAMAATPPGGGSRGADRGDLALAATAVGAVAITAAALRLRRVDVLSGPGRAHPPVTRYRDPMGLLHTYAADVVWTGAGDAGTTGYRAYGRDHDVLVPGKPVIAGSADPAFRGDPDRHTPEDLLVAALAQCHMLWFLHLAAVAGVVVVGYTDRASGTMRVEAAGHGQFTEAVLRPQVTVRRAPTAGAEDHAGLDALLADVHRQAHEHCFIARSVSFPVRVEPVPAVVEQPA